MNMDEITERVAPEDLLKARELALEAGSAIAADRTRDNLVLANTAQIEVFLFSGLPGLLGLRARCSAVSQHMRNLRATLDRDSWPLDNPEEFLRVAKNYAGYLGGTDRPGRYWLAELFRREIGDKADRLVQILRDSGGGRDATPGRLAFLLGIDRVVILRLFHEAFLRDLIRSSGKIFSVWPDGNGDEDSWVLSEFSKDTQP